MKINPTCDQERIEGRVRPGIIPQIFNEFDVRCESLMMGNMTRYIDPIEFLVSKRQPESYRE
jgi:hypothetical protein